MDESRVRRIEESEVAKLGSRKNAISAFAASVCEELTKTPDKDCVVLPSNADGLVRKMFHGAAEKAGLRHSSLEKDGEKRLVVWKDIDPSRLYDPDPPAIEVETVTREEVRVKVTWRYEVKAPVKKVTLTFSALNSAPSEHLIEASAHGTAETEAHCSLQYTAKGITARSEMPPSNYLTVRLETDAEHLECLYTIAGLQQNCVYAVTAVAGHESAESEITKRHVLTLKSPKGKLKCWGNNSQGAFGFVGDQEIVNSPSDFQSTVSSIPVSDFSAGYCHGAAVSEQGSIVAWGRLVWIPEGAAEPQFVASSPLLVTPSQPTRFCQVACADTHNLALSTAGVVFAWGLGNVGELGLGSRNFAQGPEPLEGVEDEDFIGKPFFTAVACGQMVSMALGKDGSVFEWGLATHPADPLVPIVLPRPKYVKSTIGGSICLKISAGSGYKAAVMRNRELYMWGQNMAGVLGNGTTAPASCPMRVATGEVVDVSCGASHVCALLSSGEVATWGRGEKGQLGHADYRSYATPRVLQSLSAVSAVSCNGNHSLFLLADGSLWACGQGKNGCLGIGVKGKAGTARRVKAEASVTAVAAGVMHCLATFR